jgi:hypothetical protein
MEVVLIVMIHRPKSVSEQPEAVITHWSVRELSNGDRHLIGVIPESGHDGRVSSKIMEYADRVVTTRSGRRYHLSGEPGQHLDADYVWAAWCFSNSVDPSSARDVTKEYVVPIN